MNSAGTCMQDRNFNKYTTLCRFAKPLHVFRKRMRNNMEAKSSSFKRLNQTYLIIREKTFSELVDLFHIVFRPVSE